MIKNKHWRLMVLFIFFAGCATVPVYTSDPATDTVKNEFFVAELEPHLASGKHYFDSFRYVFTNISKRDLQIDWQNTLYIKNGKKFGHFGREGLTVEQLKEREELPLITVAPGNTLSVLIFPLRLIAKRNPMEIDRGSRISLGIIPESESGMRLTVRQGKRVIREELKLRITITEMRK